jgi:hypothetical protein
MLDAHPITAALILGSIRRGAMAALAAGLVIGLLGPFGTFERMELGERLVFWTLCMALGTLLHVPAYWGFAWVAGQRRVPPWLWVPGSALFAALPMTLMVNGVAAALFGDIALDSFGALYPMVLAISLPVQCITYLVQRQASEASSALTALPVGPRTPDLPGAADPAPASALVSELAPQPPPAPVAGLRSIPLIAGLPARLGERVLCLQMEDHYIRVHTELGSAMVHHRMADAEASLGPHVPGLRVHRSWWVARAAITGWQREGKKLSLTLSNGLVVPVARDRQATLKAAGWVS